MMLATVGHYWSLVWPSWLLTSPCRYNPASSPTCWYAGMPVRKIMGCCYKRKDTNPYRRGDNLVYCLKTKPSTRLLSIFLYTFNLINSLLKNLSIFFLWNISCPALRLLLIAFTDTWNTMHAFCYTPSTKYHLKIHHSPYVTLEPEKQSQQCKHPSDMHTEPLQNYMLTAYIKPPMLLSYPYDHHPQNLLLSTKQIIIKKI